MHIQAQFFCLMFKTSSLASLGIKLISSIDHYPESTRRRFNVDTTLFERQLRRYNVETTSCK